MVDLYLVHQMFWTPYYRVGHNYFHSEHLYVMDQKFIEQTSCGEVFLTRLDGIKSDLVLVQTTNGYLILTADGIIFESSPQTKYEEIKSLHLLKITTGKIFDQKLESKQLPEFDSVIWKQLQSLREQGKSYDTSNF